ncbi:hypothetical protein E2C01_006897 [Portunus trituberculatus]|uniref:Uncharacterized protein n=1 Tax=Portunus trituberculatus TaxID=210409 RepID=A0A5B7CXI7_PORTR|nr:hypothetical protein [Portunus trituberculatus]
MHIVLLSEPWSGTDPTGLAALQTVYEAALSHIREPHNPHCDGCLDVLVATVVLQQLQQHICSQATQRLVSLLLAALLGFFAPLLLCLLGRLCLLDHLVIEWQDDSGFLVSQIFVSTLKWDP